MNHLKKIFRTFLWLSMAGIFGFALILSASILYISPNLPTVDSLKDITLQTPLKIYTADGKLIAEYGEKRREPLLIGQVPDLLIKALLAAEDQNFFHHHGVDPKGLLRAAYELATTGHIHSGGSTITMQVARNFFLSNKQTFSRKFNEILLATKMERELSKQDILELYINKIYLGNRAYGFGAAAKIYYGKELSQLDLAELAMIAGLPKAPSRFNPIADPERALTRRNWILERMQTLGFIDAQHYQQASTEALNIHPQIVQQDPETLYIAEMARQDVVTRFGPQVYDAGYSVVVTIDSALQAAANRAVIQGLLAYDQRHGYRGPEAKIPLPNNNEDPSLYWPKQLSKFSPINELIPGVVIHADPTQANVMLADGSQITLGLPQIKWARKYISATQMGPTPKKITDVLAVGNIIRLQAPKESNDTWKLTQLPAVEGALIAIDPNNGAIKSLIGGFSYDRSNFNRVTQASRQVGSSIKPFIYSAALAKGYTAASIVNDAPLVFENGSQDQAWRPENATGNFLGPMRLRKALYESRNLVSIRLLNQMGVQDALDYLTPLGFDTNQFPRDLSLALGSVDLTPLTVASAFTLFANGGYKISPYLIETISDTQGRIVYQAKPVKVCHTCVEIPPPQEPTVATTEEDPFSLDEAENNNATLALAPPPAPLDPTQAPRVMDAKIAYIMRSMLQDVIARGTGIGARAVGRKDVGGKTGTTNDQKDAWFTGFNSDLVASVWVGFDTPSQLGAGEYGARAALPIWVDYMKVALKGKPDKKYSAPPGIVTVLIDPATGLRATPGQKGAIAEIFDAAHLPPSSSGAPTNSSAPAEEGKDGETTTPAAPPVEQLF